MKKEERPVTVKILKETLSQAFSDFGRTFGREMRDFVRQEIGASEVRIKKHVAEKITDLKTEMLDGVTDIIDNGINPQFDNHEQRLLKLETQA